MMRRRNHAPLLPLAGLLLLLSGCLDQAPRASLELRLRGPVYPRARCAKGPAAMGKHYPAGDPVAGAIVTLEPGAFSARTDAAGGLKLTDLPEGSYTLSVSKPGFQPAPPRQVVLRSGEDQRLALRLEPCVFGGGNKYDVGFSTPLILTADAATFCSSFVDASYTWAQLEGPKLAADESEGWTTQQLKFVTAKLEQLRSLPQQPQILSFSPDQAGQYVFSVTARSKGGVISKDYVYVTATSVTGGVNSVAPYARYYVVGQEQGPWQWKILSWPDGWARTLRGETSRTPSISIIPGSDYSGQRTLVIKNMLSSTQPFSFVVGDWDWTPRDCGRQACHPALQASWEQTRHASTWQRLIDGELKAARAEPAESCATCHALGHDRRPSAKNGGYDDNADRLGVSFPDFVVDLQPGNYAALDQEIKEVGSVYCLGCHGPARVDPPVAEQPGRFEVGVCARCHDRLPEQDLVAQWRTNKMSRTIRGELNGPESKAECTRCHTAQGFYYQNFALGRPPNPDVVVMICCENLAPISCQTCHSPMYADNQAQLFKYGQVKTESGLALKQVGAGALCSMCHNTGHDTAAAATLTERLAPHSPQADLSYGRGGYVLPAAGHLTPSGAACAKDAGEGCANCHMHKGPAYGQPGYRQVGDHTFRMTTTGGAPNVAACQGCHPTMQSFDPLARGDYDGNGTRDSVRKEVDGLLALLKLRLGAAIQARGFTGCDAGKSAGAWIKRGFRHKLVLTDALGFDLGDCDRSGEIERAERAFTFAAADVLLHKAAYNYLYLKYDRSRGLHNVPYAVILLQRTLVALTSGVGLPRWDRFATRTSKAQ